MLGNSLILNITNGKQDQRNHPAVIKTNDMKLFLFLWSSPRWEKHQKRSDLCITHLVNTTDSDSRSVMQGPRGRSSSSITTARIRSSCSPANSHTAGYHPDERILEAVTNFSPMCPSASQSSFGSISSATNLQSPSPPPGYRRIPEE
uniref:Uncharacterized protein n=1 Tax=Glossina palpalis gambiensis TaxID=67801 RepID=A0A1B0C3R7_9MUSC